MIDEYGIANKRDKSRGIKKSNIRASNKEFTNGRFIRNGNRLSGTNEFCAACLKYPTEKCRNRHRRSGDSGLREEISEAIKSKHLLVLKDP
jgi:hypothetical protein